MIKTQQSHKNLPWQFFLQFAIQHGCESQEMLTIPLLFAMLHETLQCVTCSLQLEMQTFLLTRTLAQHCIGGED